MRFRQACKSFVLIKKKGGPNIGPPFHFLSCEQIYSSQLIRPALRQRIRILAQKVERGGFFR